MAFNVAQAVGLLAASVKCTPSQDTYSDGSVDAAVPAAPQNAVMLKLYAPLPPQHAASGLSLNPEIDGEDEVRRKLMISCRWLMITGACMRTVFPGRRDEVGDGAVEVGVEDGCPRVRSPELSEHAVQRAVVQLREVVERLDAAGRRVVVAALVEGEQLWLAAERYHPRNQHGPRSGGDHLLQAFSCTVGMEHSFI